MVMPIIRRVVQSGSDIYSDGWRSYDALAVYGYNHKKVKHTENEFAREDGTHINGVESYWSWTKRRLAQFNGLTRKQFREYMLESEWRFNHRNSLKMDLKRLLKKLR
ncbi:MAG: IS1595 family transposase [Patescibacteria group bacterium]